MKLIKFSYLLLSVFSINFSLAQNCDLPPNYTGNTGSNMSIFLAATFISSLNATDENAYLVALTSSGLVVGSTSIYGLSQSSIALWSDDSQTPEIDGALANEVISFQLVNGTDLYDVFMPNPVVYEVNDLIFLINPAVTTLVECNASVYGCTDATAFNYNSSANTDDNSCIEVIEGCTDANACNYNAAATDSDDDICCILTVAIDTSSLTSVLTAIVSPADSVVAYSWLFNGAEVGIESTYTALENGVYSVEVSNSTCDAASFEIQYVSLHELNPLEVNLYPNPFKDIINIDFIKSTSNIELRILNTLGEEVKYEKIVQNRDGSEIQIQVSDLPKGMYILRVNSGNYLNSFVLIKN
jgi:hypothetical protein